MRPTPAPYPPIIRIPTGNLCMTGRVRTKEKCPRCGGKFAGEPLTCPACLTTPRRYFVHFHWQGEPIKLYTGKDGHPLDSWERAYRLLTAMRNEVDLGKFDPKDYIAKEIKSLVFENYIRTWLTRREQECCRQHLARSYFKDLKGAAQNYFVPYFQSKNIRDIRAGDIEDFRNQLPETLSLKTVRNLLGYLHKLFQDAYRWRDILHLPIFPRVRVKEPITRWITEEDQERILARVKEPVYRAFYLFLMKQGCRPGEARALRWERLDMDNDLVIIDAAMDLNNFRASTKEKDVRVLPLHPEVKGAIQKLPRALNGYVFVNRQGRPLSSCRVYDHWRMAAEKAGIKITCYEGTRHSLASQAANRGVSLWKIGKMLGHKTPAMTKRYAKLATESLKEVWKPSPETVPKSSPEGKVIDLTNRKKDKK